MAEETIRPVPEGRERLFISYGIAIPATAARHVIEIFHATRVHVIRSGSLAQKTDES